MKNGKDAEGQERKNETGVKSFIVVMSILMIAAAILTVGSYNGYHPNPASVSLTGFILIVMILLTTVWYRTKYPGFRNGGGGGEN
ncbi:MAG: hypothetical protein M1117_03955 [Candidatus Thermoplasmatota archaeon]|nr:hypothetical protein [Candidatus Thermoplasmatota archaeon]